MKPAKAKKRDLADDLLDSGLTGHEPRGRFKLEVMTKRQLRKAAFKYVAEFIKSRELCIFGELADESGMNDEILSEVQSEIVSILEKRGK